MNEPITPGRDKIVLYSYGRDEASTTLECYVGGDIAGDTSGEMIYALLYKPFGSPSFTTIYSYQGGGAQLGEPPFIIEKYWVYTHNHGSTESAQYSVVITNTLDATSIPSNTVSVPRFRGFGSKTTRLSSNGLLKNSRKTRNETPRF